MEIVTGLRGTPHITSADAIGFQQGIATVGSGALPVGEKFRSELASNNELKIYDGEGVIQGVHFRVLPGTYDSITLENGAQGQKRKDLIVVRYTKDAETGYENTVWAVKKGTSTTGTPAEPTATEGDIRAGDALAEVPWYVVEYDGINVTSVTPKFSTLMNIQELTEGFGELNRKLSGRLRSLGFTAGSIVVTRNGNLASIISSASIDSAFGVSGSNETNTAVFLSNGDGLTNDTDITSQYRDGNWYAKFSGGSNGAVRINYMVVRWNLS